MKKPMMFLLVKAIIISVTYDYMNLGTDCIAVFSSL